MIQEGSLSYDVLMWALSLLGTVITTIILPAILELIKGKIKNEKLKHVVDELGITVATSVAYVNQTFVDQLKKDGCFDVDKQKEAFNAAVNYALNSLTETTKKIIESEGVDLQELIEKRIEAYINSLK